MNLDEMLADELNILALAMDYLIHNSSLPSAVMKDVEELFYYIDALAEAAGEEVEDDRLLETVDNLLVVDFRPKAG